MRLHRQWQGGCGVVGHDQHVAVGEGQDLVLGAVDPLKGAGAQRVVLAQLQQAAYQQGLADMDSVAFIEVLRGLAGLPKRV